MAQAYDFSAFDQEMKGLAPAREAMATALRILSSNSPPPTQIAVECGLKVIVVNSGASIDMFRSTWCVRLTGDVSRERFLAGVKEAGRLDVPIVVDRVYAFTCTSGYDCEYGCAQNMVSHLIARVAEEPSEHALAHLDPCDQKAIHDDLEWCRSYSDAPLFSSVPELLEWDGFLWRMDPLEHQFKYHFEETNATKYSKLREVTHLRIGHPTVDEMVLRSAEPDGCDELRFRYPEGDWCFGFYETGYDAGYQPESKSVFSHRWDVDMDEAVAMARMVPAEKDLGTVLIRPQMTSMRWVDGRLGRPRVRVFHADGDPSSFPFGPYKLWTESPTALENFALEHPYIYDYPVVMPNALVGKPRPTNVLAYAACPSPAAAVRAAIRSGVSWQQPRGLMNGGDYKWTVRGAHVLPVFKNVCVFHPDLEPPEDMPRVTSLSRIPSVPSWVHLTELPKGVIPEWVIVSGEVMSSLETTGVLNLAKVIEYEKVCGFYWLGKFSQIHEVMKHLPMVETAFVQDLRKLLLNSILRELVALLRTDPLYEEWYDQAAWLIHMLADRPGVEVVLPPETEMDGMLYTVLAKMSYFPRLGKIVGKPPPGANVYDPRTGLYAHMFPPEHPFDWIGGSLAAAGRPLGVPVRYVAMVDADSVNTVTAVQEILASWEKNNDAKVSEIRFFCRADFGGIKNFTQAIQAGLFSQRECSLTTVGPSKDLAELVMLVTMSQRHKDNLHFILISRDNLVERFPNATTFCGVSSEKLVC